MLRLKDALGREVVANIVNGRSVSLPESRTFSVRSAVTGEAVHYAQSATVEVAKDAVQAAVQAFSSWKRTSVTERRNIINRAADILERRLDDVVERETKETSCTEHWAKHDAGLATVLMRETAMNIAGICGSIPPPISPDVTSLLFKEPIGAVLIIPPWNAALILSLRGVSTAIGAGCTVILKASELCPWTHQLILEIFTEAGLPPGVINQIQADRADAVAVTEALIADPGIKKIEFIGSAGVGKVIAGLGAKYLKPVLMECGDQSPCIILDDADLEQAATLCAQGALAHSGQLCWSTERILVQSKVKDRFLEFLVAAFKAFQHTGCCITERGAQHTKTILEAAVADGARFLVGDAELTGKTALKASLVADINKSSRLATEEVFGPTASVYIVDNDADAISEANRTSFGLSAAVFTADYRRGLKMARELEFGQVQINAMTIYASAAAPVTGLKSSGWGSNGGPYGIEEFLFIKHVSLHDAPRVMANGAPAS